MRLCFCVLQAQHSFPYWATVHCLSSLPSFPCRFMFHLWFILVFCSFTKQRKIIAIIVYRLLANITSGGVWRFLYLKWLNCMQVILYFGSQMFIYCFISQLTYQKDCIRQEADWISCPSSKLSQSMCNILVILSYFLCVNSVRGMRWLITKVIVLVSALWETSFVRDGENHQVCTMFYV